ncbi:MAG: hypothetical protein IPH44_35410 [Myxococcales bacterium]|nr:hypothetical protein [Myxococcales bacterium]MBK7194728.1 hypothetical protein [Myxococcales bacterium]MBP6846382.1 hypothetical protein [Kofleriaceae bacterium]
MKHVAFALIVGIAAAGCGGKKDPANDPPASGKTTAPPPGKAAAAELATAAEPAGITWKAVPQPFGSVELPSGDGWEIVEGQLEGKDGTVVMMQSQDGITPDQLDDYLASYDEVQRRDAPKYAGKPATKGAVGGAPAVRVEGSFDNGTRFVTRDYLIFAKGKVVMLSARAPEAGASGLAGVIDHVARSATIK